MDLYPGSAGILPNDGRIPANQLERGNLVECPKCHGEAREQPEVVVKDAEGNILRVDHPVRCSACDKKALKDAKQAWRENRHKKGHNPVIATPPILSPLIETPAAQLCPCKCGRAVKLGKRYAAAGCHSRALKGTEEASALARAGAAKRRAKSGKGRETPVTELTSKPATPILAQPAIHPYEEVFDGYALAAHLARKYTRKQLIGALSLLDAFEAP